MIKASELDRVIFGCGNFGGTGSSPSLRGYGDDADTAWTLLDAARRAGLTRFDTANTYGGGASEETLGAWLRAQESGFRQTIQVASKVGNPHGCPAGQTPLSGAQVAYHLDRSLQRLGLERLHLYYLHEFDAQTPLEETLAAISNAIDAGKIELFGVSNASLSDLEAIKRLADPRVLARFSYVQNEFSLLQTQDRAEVIPWARAQKFRYVAFSPLAGGLLTGKYSLSQPPDPATRLGQAFAHYAPYMTEDSFQTIEALRKAASEKGASIAGAALRFVLDCEGVDSLIIAPRTPAHFQSYGLRPG